MATMQWWMAGMVGLALGCASTTTVPAEPRQDPPVEAEPQDPPADAPPAPEGPDAEMQAWTEAGMVKEHHHHLAGFAGEWTVTTRAWFEPGMEPVESPGTARNTVVLDRRFVHLTYEGTMQVGPDQRAPFAGMGLLGYDNLEKWHTAMWVDSMSTAMMVLHGTCDDDGQRLTMIGTFSDAVTGEAKTMRWVYRLESADRYVLEIYMPDRDGNEYKAVESVHERKG